MDKNQDRPVVKDVDSYLAAIPEPQRTALLKLRQTILSIVPEAGEKISYQIPTVTWQGGLVAYAAFKNHCSLFVMSKALVERFNHVLKDYSTSTGTIHFTPEKPIPDDIVKMIVIARKEQNEENTRIKLERKAQKASAKKSATS